jgi:hypothetical protein
MTDEPPPTSVLTRPLPTKWVLSILGFVLVAAAVGVLWIRHWHTEHRQALPPSILKGLASSQSYFRERSPDLRYATSLATLDEHWGSGIYTNYNGYTYEILPPPGDPSFTWAARAFPVTEPGWRHYYVDHTGLIRFETGKPAGPESPVWVKPE